MAHDPREVNSWVKLSHSPTAIRIRNVEDLSGLPYSRLDLESGREPISGKEIERGDRQEPAPGDFTGRQHGNQTRRDTPIIQTHVETPLADGCEESFAGVPLPSESPGHIPGRMRGLHSKLLK